MASSSRTIIEISPKTIFWILGIGILAALLYMVRDIIGVLIFAIIIASALEPILQFAESKKLPRLLSLIVIYILFFVVFAAVIYIILPLILDQFRDFTQNYPDYFGKIEEAAGTITFLPGLSANVRDLLDQLTVQIPSFTSLLSYASSIFGGIISFIIVLVISFYLSLSRGALDDFLGSVMPPQFEAYAHGLWIRAQKKMGRWLQAQVLLSFIMAAIVGIGLWILGGRDSRDCALCRPHCGRRGVNASGFITIADFRPLDADIFCCRPAVGKPRVGASSYKKISRS